MTIGFLDFETEAIQDAPAYPPTPVGFSYLVPGMRKPKYMGWGHPEGNTCTRADAVRVIETMWADSKLEIVCQNAAFDMRVAQDKMGMVALPWERVHDTLYLLALSDPHSRNIGLKPSAQRLLGMEPLDEAEMYQWLKENGHIKSLTQRDRGAYISRAPGTMVAPYANSDITMTKGIFDLLYKDVCETRGMREAYDLERRLSPILMRNEREGVRVDLVGLSRDVPLYQAAMERADAWIRKRLAAPELNIDSDSQLADALERAGVVTEWQYTDKGSRITRKDTLTPDKFSDPQVASALGYRNRLATCLGTFMEKWLRTAEASGGRVFTQWQQVVSPSGGARTFRLSSRPNFQNLPRDFTENNDGYVHPKFLRALPPLPNMRGYFLPDSAKHTWVSHDYQGQELRVFAHFSDGDLMRQYQADPKLDVHGYTQRLIRESSGQEYTRTQIKIIGFTMLYGGGVEAIRLKTGMTKDEVIKFRAAYHRAVPDLAKLTAEVKAVLKSGAPVIAWGGRQLYAEPPTMFNGRLINWDYKVLNALVQGSAAAQTKTAMIEYDSMRKEGRMLLSVHDEIAISVPTRAWKRESKLLDEAMRRPNFDVPMLTEASYGPNWGDQEDA